MKMKTCIACHKEYPATTRFFFAGKTNSDGLRGKCKACMVLYSSERRKSKEIIPNTDESIKKKCAICGQEFPATIDYFFAGYCRYGLRSKCKKCFQSETKIRKTTPKYKQKHKEYGKKHYAENRAEFAARWQVYYKANAEHLKKKGREYNKNNLPKLRILDQKRREDPKFRLSQNISGSIRQSLFRHNGKGGAPWESLVDFTKQDLVEHIEKLFEPGMTWDNYGEWHLDHKIPKSVFNFTNPSHEDFKRCWSLSNLQPMWAKENLTKSAKLKKHFQPRLQMGAA